MVGEGFVDVDGTQAKELEVKFGCTQTVRDMLIDQCQLFQDLSKRRIPKYAMKKKKIVPTTP